MRTMVDGIIFIATEVKLFQIVIGQIGLYNKTVFHLSLRQFLSRVSIGSHHKSLATRAKRRQSLRKG